MPVICPCCHQPIAAAKAPIEALEAAPLTRLEHRIVKALADSYPRKVTTIELIDACYGEEADGGPDFAQNVITITMRRLRMKLSSYGWTIPKSKRGPGNGHYTLVPVEAP